ncbi:hypothetical protein SETIT_9G555700v2 [Setaria italica]|uniref:Uncharacterized protein n=1 Tax=Setaria italica TaxID=4555 RepID=A0A368SWG4_SETIT|nr:hypothetical protein SETIT_9G555700v2 [Setaria italica]
MEMWRSFGRALTLQVSSGYTRILSLRSGSDDLVVVYDCFVRFALHLLMCPSWCPSVTLVRLLLIDWVLLVSVLLMGFEDLFVDWVPAISFILGSSSLREMEKARLAAMVVGSGEDRWVLLF